MNPMYKPTGLPQHHYLETHERAYISLVNESFELVSNWRKVYHPLATHTRLEKFR